MKVRFQADADLKGQIVVAVKRREPGIDFQTADEAGLEGLEDPLVLEIAASAGRVLVSHDRRTMPQHFGDFITTNTSPGLVIAAQHLPINIVIEELVLIWAASEAEEWVNQVKSIPL
jgi:hypothetical protein